MFCKTMPGSIMNPLSFILYFLGLNSHEAVASKRKKSELLGDTGSLTVLFFLEDYRGSVCVPHVNCPRT